MLLNGEYMNKKDIENGRQEEILLILVNSYWESVTFTLPFDRLSSDWEVLADTENETEPEENKIAYGVYEVSSRSLVLLRNLK